MRRTWFPSWYSAATAAVAVTLELTRWGIACDGASAQAPTPAESPPSAARSEQPSATGAPSGTADDSPEHVPEPPTLVPPKLLEAAEPSFPDDAHAAGLTESSAVVRVTIDTTGEVSAAEVVESVGHGFDAAAERAALAHRFEPARRNGEPVAARILLRIDFRAPEPAPPPAAPKATDDPSTSSRLPLPPESPATAVEVTVQGRSEADRLRRSAAAVQVVETEDAKRRTADLGEVLARTQGVGVQRAGGLGSDTRFSLNGLTDDQVRFFLDGVPLELAGYPLGLANVPVNLVDRVEIYRGVVPIRFGADALGGAVNLVSDHDVQGSHGAASVQAGSFGTYRLTLNAHHRDEPSGWLTRVSGFFDQAENDYPMQTLVAGPSGQEELARVYRFHDGYRAEGGTVETGVVDRPGADRLLFRAFATHYDKEIQHNLLMTFNPYGDVELGELTTGGTVRYENAFARHLSLSLVGGYAYRTIDYTDVGECTYDWFGQCIRMPPQPGERVGRAQDQTYWEHSAYGRLNLDWQIRPEHAVRLSLSPTFTGRTGDERRQVDTDARDPLSAKRELFGLVTGLEYQTNLFRDRLENVVFVKDYLQGLRSEDPLSDGSGFRRRDRTTHRQGVGDSLRYTFTHGCYAKASYEWATRLPRPDEIFGNVFPVQPNLELEPELSHNVNLGITVDGLVTDGGVIRGDVNGFLRDAEQLIVLVGNDQTASYQNVYSARSMGGEVAAGWSSPGDYVAIDGNFTYADFRNDSTEGAFADHEGQRIPNRPYLFANGTARLQARNVAAGRDELALVWTTRYVHSFFRAWEGLGVDKLEVPAQLLHSLAVTYFVESDTATLSFTGEVQNLTDEEAFDFFGVPKPGRAFYFKATASL